MNGETMFNVSAKCSKCGHVFAVAQGSVSVCKQYVDEDGKSIFLTYYDCQECNERHYVQIDDEKTKVIRDDTLRQFRKLSVMRSRGDAVKKKQLKRFENLRHELRFCRLELMKLYEHRVVTDTETGENITVHFVLV